MMYPEFIGSSYTSQSVIADTERTVNLYVERVEARGAKYPTALYPTPGLRYFSSAPIGVTPGRALFEHEGRVFAVIGPNLYELDAGGGLTLLGVVLQDDNPAYIETNGDLNNELLIASNGGLYHLDLLTNAFVAIPTMTSDVRIIGYKDGFFLALLPSTSTLRISDLSNGLTWDVLRFRERQLAADRWVSMRIIGDDIWMFGSKTSDVLYNTGIAPVPFSPRIGVKIEWGTAAPFSPATLGGAPIWLGQSKDGAGMVMQADGYTPRRISHHAMEHQIQGYSTMTDAVGWTYQQDGHTFYVLTFPTAGATWVYDAALAGAWHERDYLHPATGEFSAWRAQFHVKAFGKHLVLDRASGDIYQLDLTYGYDARGPVGGGGGPQPTAIRRQRRAPHVHAQRRTLFIPRFELDMETGVGVPTGQGSAPVAMLRVSHNGGKTWGPERWADIGAGGDYDARVQWTKLGSGLDHVFEVSFSDPVPIRLVSATLDDLVVGGGR